LPLLSLVLLFEELGNRNKWRNSPVVTLVAAFCSQFSKPETHKVIITLRRHLVPPAPFDPCSLGRFGIVAVKLVG